MYYNFNAVNKKKKQDDFIFYDITMRLIYRCNATLFKKEPIHVTCNTDLGWRDDR